MRAQIEDFERHRCILGRFLAQGSAYWYAPTGGSVKTEEAPLYLDAAARIGPAVETIKEVEDAVLLAHGLEGVVLRYGMFYGPGTWYAKDGDVGRRVRKRRATRLSAMERVPTPLSTWTTRLPRP
jgi:nucleoside-diphosphate-sugar epimerase